MTYGAARTARMWPCACSFSLQTLLRRPVSKKTIHSQSPLLLAMDVDDQYARLPLAIAAKKSVSIAGLSRLKSRIGSFENGHLSLGDLRGRNKGFPRAEQGNCSGRSERGRAPSPPR